MAMRYLGDLLDIHGGGEDLVFPHHENERAQTLAATGKPLANLWMHVGFVTMKDVKMSKSLGNTVYLRDLRASYHPEALRVALLSTHYRSPLDFSFELVENTGRALYRFYVARARQEARLRSGQGGKGRTKEARALKEEFLGSLKDDLNTPRAIGAIFKTLGLLQEKPGVDEETYQELLELYKEAGEILGAFGLEPYAFLERIESAFFKEKRLDQGTLQELVRARELARGQKDFRRADAIREQVKGYGVLLEDTPEGTLVRLDV
jgi:cysteinyl-tRNA synthetase